MQIYISCQFRVWTLVLASALRFSPLIGYRQAGSGVVPGFGSEDPPSDSPLRHCITRVTWGQTEIMLHDGVQLFR
jgi:hypothetical protein